ncbi:type II secretion system minor pseudopilin GspJ [Maricaulis sp.]|uniref:type II secretion system minor pseudopilin GspJ n=1 Tax=Maricaulis sp. TaxID=1486257 RepID=UPI0026160338|nr:type II secretion system minor pseudopilin GspJ [Maricaulis sp.]
MTHAGAGDSGFSLIEVLVSVFILAVIGAISVSLMSASLTARDVNHEALDRTAMLDRARTLLREDLGQVALRPVRDADGYRAGEIFAGDDNGIAVSGPHRGERVILSFTRHGRPNPGLLLPRSSLVHVDYVVDEDRLIRRARDYPDATDRTRLAEQVLLEGIEDVRLELLVGAAWSRRARLAASGEGVLPSAVRLSYGWPPLGEMEHVVLTPGGPS